jgi:hypothetical protein
MNTPLSDLRPKNFQPQRTKVVFGTFSTNKLEGAGKTEEAVQEARDAGDRAGMAVHEAGMGRLMDTSVWEFVGEPGLTAFIEEEVSLLNTRSTAADCWSRPRDSLHVATRTRPLDTGFSLYSSLSIDSLQPEDAALLPAFPTNLIPELPKSPPATKSSYSAPSAPSASTSLSASSSYKLC